MRHLTAIICLILAVLLGSAGVSWSADLQKEFELESNATAYDEAHDYVTGELEMEEGINISGRGEYVLSIGTGDTIVEAFCAAVTNAAVDINGLEFARWLKVAPRRADGLIDLSQRPPERESNTPLPTPSARMKSYMSQRSKGYEASLTSSASGTLNSKYIIQVFKYEEYGMEKDLDGKDVEHYVFVFEGSIKSPKANLNCFQLSSSTEGEEFIYQFNSETMEFAEFVEELELNKRVFLKTFTEKSTKKKFMPTIAIIFASKVSMWQ